MIRAASAPTLLKRPLPSGMLARELLVTATRPRALVIKVLVPLVLAVPLVAGHAPTFWAGMLLTVLCAMIGAVGAGMTVARARESGLLERLSVTPRRPFPIVGGWVAGGAVIDTLQLLPAIAVVIALGPTTPVSAVSLLLMACAVLIVANTLGFVVSAAGGGAAEVLLDTVILLAPLLFLGGLFTGVPADGWRAVAARVDPFSYLHAAFIDALGGAPAYASVAVVAAAFASVGAALVLIALAAPLVLRRR
ncbi:MAG: ABC transporter permease [Candidatus Dormibacteria bacterium]